MKHLQKRHGRRASMARRADWMDSVTRGSMACDWQARHETVFGGLVHPDEWQRWLRQGPCPGCPCERWCDRVCSLRAKWWDDPMARLRKRLGMR